MKATAKHSYFSDSRQLELFPLHDLSRADKVIIESVNTGWVTVDPANGLITRHNGILAWGCPNHDGYLRIGLTPRPHFAAQVFAHRIIAYALWGYELFRWEVNHINENKQDNRACNLELVSRDYNMQYSMNGAKNHMTILTEEQVLEIKRRYKPHDKNGNSGRDLAREYGVHFGTISTIIVGRTWRRIG